jgi:hypothetical protein
VHEPPPLDDELLELDDDELDELEDDELLELDDELELLLEELDELLEPVASHAPKSFQALVQAQPTPGSYAPPWLHQPPTVHWKARFTLRTICPVL